MIAAWKDVEIRLRTLADAEQAAKAGSSRAEKVGHKAAAEAYLIAAELVHSASGVCGATAPKVVPLNYQPFCVLPVGHASKVHQDDRGGYWVPLPTNEESV